MGRKRPQAPIFVQDIVVKSRSFPLFPPSFQHSTSVLHMPRGKKAHTPPFHNSSTAPSPKQRPQKIRMAAKRRRVFNTLPSPYYCYYNKYNKKQGKKPCIQQQTMQTLWGKELSGLPAADCGPKAAKDPAEKSEKLTRLRVCGFASCTGETAGAARTEAPSPGRAGPGAALPRCGPAAKPPAECCQRTLRGPSRAAQERRNRSG